MTIEVGKSYNWNELTIEQRYWFWSLHLENGGLPIAFYDFCDLMDLTTSSELVSVTP